MLDGLYDFGNAGGKLAGFAVEYGAACGVAFNVVVHSCAVGVVKFIELVLSGLQLVLAALVFGFVHCFLGFIYGQLDVLQFECNFFLYVMYGRSIQLIPEDFRIVL